MTLTIDDLAGLRAATAADLGLVRDAAWTTPDALARFRVHDGDLALDDDFDGAAAALVVRGALTVAGTVGVATAGALIVTGRLRCRNLACAGYLEVQGDADVGETVVGVVAAGASWFDGHLRARLLVEGDHPFEYDPARLVVDTHLGFENFGGLRIGTAAAARAVLSDDAFAALAPVMGLAAAGPAGPAAPDLFGLLRTDGFLRG